MQDHTAENFQISDNNLDCFIKIPRLLTNPWGHKSQTQLSD